MPVSPKILQKVLNYEKLASSPRGSPRGGDASPKSLSPRAGAPGSPKRGDSPVHPANLISFPGLDQDDWGTGDFQNHFNSDGEKGEEKPKDQNQQKPNNEGSADTRNDLAKIKDTSQHMLELTETGEEGDDLDQDSVGSLNFEDLAQSEKVEKAAPPNPSPSSTTTPLANTSMKQSLVVISSPADLLKQPPKGRVSAFEKRMKALLNKSLPELPFYDADDTDRSKDDDAEDEDLRRRRLHQSVAQFDYYGGSDFQDRQTSLLESTFAHRVSLLNQDGRQGALYTGDDSVTAFDEQMRLARERARQCNYSQPKNATAVVSPGSVKQRKAMFLKRPGNAVFPKQPGTTPQTPVSPPRSCATSSTSSETRENQFKKETKQETTKEQDQALLTAPVAEEAHDHAEKGNDSFDAKDMLEDDDEDSPYASTSAAPVTDDMNHGSFSDFEAQLQAAAERQRRQEKPSQVVIPGNRNLQQRTEALLGASMPNMNYQSPSGSRKSTVAVPDDDRLHMSFSGLGPYTGDSGITPYEEQMRLARARAARSGKPNLVKSPVSITQRQNLFLNLSLSQVDKASGNLRPTPLAPPPPPPLAKKRSSRSLKTETQVEVAKQEIDKNESMKSSPSSPAPQSVRAPTNTSSAVQPESATVATKEELQPTAGVHVEGEFTREVDDHDSFTADEILADPTEVLQVAPSSIPVYTHDSSFASFEEQLQAAAEREKRRKQAEALKSTGSPKTLQDRTDELFGKSLPKMETQKSVNKDDGEAEKNPYLHMSFTRVSSMDAAALNQELSMGASYTGDFGLTSFDEQMKLARERAKLVQSPNKKKVDVGLSLKDRMKALNAK